MSKNSAEYMRAYRARRKAEEVRIGADEVAEFRLIVRAAKERIVELEEEVRHLKAELARRNAYQAEEIRINLGPPPTRKAQQASRDAILRKINRGG